MVQHQFEVIYKAYQKQMLYVAEGVLHNRADSEDAVQNALIRISRQVKCLPENETALRAYVLTAARNAALDLLPKQRRETDIEDVIAPAPDDLFAQLAASQDYGRLLSTIKHLPLKYREVLMLRYVQDLETKQISRLLNRSKATVQKQLARAKALLAKEYFQEEL